MSVNSKMTALADEVRELSGSTGKMSIDDMTSALNTENTNFNTNLETQDNLIEQIQTALAGKAAGGGITLPTLTNPASASDILSGKETIDGSGNKIIGTIATKTASDLTASGATVTVPAGYYANQATKSVASGSAKTPATTITKTPSISVSSSGLITASVSGTQNVTPTVSAGYVSSGTAGTITVSGSATKQLTTQGAQTITPGTSNKTIASGRYLTGTQTIKGDANLVAGNIKKGVSIFGVTGTHEGGEDLEEVIAEQEALITELSTALDNKAGGSGGSSGGGISAELCDVTLTLTASGMAPPTASHIIYTTIENNIIQTKSVYPESDFSVSYPNGMTGSRIYTGTLSCTVGTNIYLFDATFIGPLIATSDNITLTSDDDYGLMFECSINSGSTGTIDIT